MGQLYRPHVRSAPTPTKCEAIPCNVCGLLRGARGKLILRLRLRVGCLSQFWAPMTLTIWTGFGKRSGGTPNHVVCPEDSPVVRPAIEFICWIWQALSSSAEGLKLRTKCRRRRHLPQSLVVILIQEIEKVVDGSQIIKYCMDKLSHVIPCHYVWIPVSVLRRSASRWSERQAWRYQRYRPGCAVGISACPRYAFAPGVVPWWIDSSLVESKRRMEARRPRAELVGGSRR